MHWQKLWQKCCKADVESSWLNDHLVTMIIPGSEVFLLAFITACSISVSANTQADHYAKSNCDSAAL
jgi:hypothetical protein